MKPNSHIKREVKKGLKHTYRLTYVHDYNKKAFSC